MSGIHHEDPKDTKSTGAAPSPSVLDKFERTPEPLFARDFVSFVHFVVSLGEEWGAVTDLPTRSREARARRFAKSKAASPVVSPGRTPDRASDRVVRHPSHDPAES